MSAGSHFIPLQCLCTIIIENISAAVVDNIDFVYLIGRLSSWHSLLVYRYVANFLRLEKNTLKCVVNAIFDTADFLENRGHRISKKRLNRKINFWAFSLAADVLPTFLSALEKHFRIPRQKTLSKINNYQTGHSSSPGF